MDYYISSIRALMELIKRITPFLKEITLVIATICLIIAIIVIIKKNKKNEKKGKTLALLIISITLIVILIPWITVVNVYNTKFQNSLNKQNTIENLTYYVQSDWRESEKTTDEMEYRYYYPFNDDTTIMITYSKRKIEPTPKDVSLAETSPEEVFIMDFDKFVDGLIERGAKIKSKRIKSLKDKNCGVVKFNLNLNGEKYERVDYFMLNSNEVYTFSFLQKNRLENKNIILLENMVLKSSFLNDIY